MDNKQVVQLISLKIKQLEKFFSYNADFMKSVHPIRRIAITREIVKTIMNLNSETLKLPSCYSIKHLIRQEVENAMKSLKLSDLLSKKQLEIMIQRYLEEKIQEQSDESKADTECDEAITSNSNGTTVETSVVGEQSGENNDEKMTSNGNEVTIETSVVGEQTDESKANTECDEKITSNGNEASVETSDVGDESTEVDIDIRKVEERMSQLENQFQDIVRIITNQEKDDMVKEEKIEDRENLGFMVFRVKDPNKNLQTTTNDETNQTGLENAFLEFYYNEGTMALIVPQKIDKVYTFTKIDCDMKNDFSNAFCEPKFQFGQIFKMFWRQ